MSRTFLLFISHWVCDTLLGPELTKMDDILIFMWVIEREKL